MESLTALRIHLTSQLAPVSRQWIRLLESRLGDAEITGASVVPLVLIGRSGGGLQQVALAEQSGISAPSLVRLLDKLCAAALVRREEAPGDRRAKTLWLTTAGLALAQRLEQRMMALRQEIFGDLPASDIEATIRVFAAISSAAADVPVDDPGKV